MLEMTSPKRGGSFTELRDAFSQKQTWLLAIGLLIILILVFCWPSFGIVWEFLFICCFPVGLFCFALIRSGAIRRPPMTKIVVVAITVHCLLLAGTLYLWRAYPKTRTGDFAFGFVVIELAVMGLLMRFTQARQDGTRSGQ
jgi:hypothetical protein